MHDSVEDWPRGCHVTVPATRLPTVLALPTDAVSLPDRPQIPPPVKSSTTLPDASHRHGKLGLQHCNNPRDLSPSVTMTELTAARVAKGALSRADHWRATCSQAVETPSGRQSTAVLVVPWLGHIGTRRDMALDLTARASNGQPRGRGTSSPSGLRCELAGGRNSQGPCAHRIERHIANALPAGDATVLLGDPAVRHNPQVHALHRVLHHEVDNCKGPIYVLARNHQPHCRLCARLLCRPL